MSVQTVRLPDDEHALVQTHVVRPVSQNEYYRQAVLQQVEKDTGAQLVRFMGRLCYCHGGPGRGFPLCGALEDVETRVNMGILNKDGYVIRGGSIIGRREDVQELVGYCTDGRRVGAKQTKSQVPAGGDSGSPKADPGKGDHSPVLAQGTGHKMQNGLPREG